MYIGNRSTVTEFILLGLSEDPLTQIVLFYMFLVAYIITLAGNLLLIVAVRVDNRLHNSMYLFLANLSFLDICCTSTIVPKTLANLLSHKKSISFTACAFQVFFYLFLGETEFILLAFMAYDRYVAICHPLHYTMIMNTAVCLWLISTSWLIGCTVATIDIYFTLSLTYCGPNTINHFLCEASLLMQLSCSDISSFIIFRLVGSALFLFAPLSLILTSYYRIIVAIVRIRTGKYKAFSKCVPHLVSVAILYGAPMLVYIMQNNSVTEDRDKMVAVFYTMFNPMINPIIYSLRNKDVHGAMRRLDILHLTKNQCNCLKAHLGK
ncbi:olfactory receptor 2D3-like [Hyperolius riggenbachi]|uniref:olfactory receptor 2D3-like n=1 Tax=Hyperolius riggenbachi TaxID=752182 RepID=UPI0035A2F1EE